MDTISKKLKIRKNGKYIFIEINAIAHCKADGCYSSIFMSSGESYLISKPLGDLESLLSKDFYRCHRGYLVNLMKVEAIDFKKKIINQKLYQIPVSHRKFDELLSKCNVCIKTRI